MEKEELLGFYIGLDLAQASDYTAIIVMDHVRRWEVDEHQIIRDPSQAPPLDKREAPKAPIALNEEYRVRHIKRCNHRSYVEIVDLVGKLIKKIDRSTSSKTHLIIDETGVGKAIVDMFRDAGLNPIPVTFHGGTNTTKSQGSWHVPVRDCVAAAKRLLATKQLKIIDNPLTETLVRELENFQVKINPATGHDSYSAWRENEHDDLVFSLSLACWYCLKKQKIGGKVIMGIQVGENEGRWSRLTGFGER
jgi:phage terminase large subunit-like protein